MTPEWLEDGRKYPMMSCTTYGGCGVRRPRAGQSPEKVAEAYNLTVRAFTAAENNTTGRV